MEVEVESAVPRSSVLLGNVEDSNRGLEVGSGEDAVVAEDGSFSMRSYYEWRIAELEELLRRKVQNKLRLEAQRNELNTRVRNLRDELKELMRPGFYVGEVVKVMGKNKVLVKVCVFLFFLFYHKKKKKKKKFFFFFFFFTFFFFFFFFFFLF